ncbi:hypothetical protein SAMN05421882_11132 [Nitrosomonas communis]|uniref:Uncharacterized protein n=1 Tax=Nitrosomonas communis TaxID=44574 RepID=A0A1H3A3W4_9PROT|nr:hypothetical protein SAMN05421882_11132 [Nitrosomonas communis]
MLLLVVIICLRFSVIAWALEDLGTRLFHSIKLFLWCTLFGLLLAIVRIVFRLRTTPMQNYLFQLILLGG